MPEDEDDNVTPEDPKDIGSPRNYYPANSNKAKQSRDKPDERKKLDRVTTTDVVTRKKPLSRRIAETFTGDDAHSVGHYLLFDVILPAVKTMISDAASQGVERLLFGDNYRPGAGNRRPGVMTNYNKISNGSISRSDTPRVMSQRAKATHDFDEVVLATRDEAQEVLMRLSDLVRDYDVASVSELYDLVGITGSWTDDKWGWYDLRSAGVVRVRDGYLLNLPRTVPID